MGLRAPASRRVLASARKADPAKRISVDFQQRYGKDYRKAYQIVKSSQFGAIRMIRAAWMAGGIVFSYAANQFSTRGYRDVSEIFIGEKGAITTSRQGYRHHDKIVDEKLPPRGYVIPSGKEAPTVVPTEYDITEDPVAEFVDGVRLGKVENAAFPPVESMYTAIMVRTAIYTGKEVTREEIQRM